MVRGKMFRRLLAVPLIAAALLAGAPSASAASLTRVTDFGANPSNLQMYLYVPNTVKPRPAVLVAVHYCTGSGPGLRAIRGR
jgi:acetylxylan esterase